MRIWATDEGDFSDTIRALQKMQDNVEGIIRDACERAMEALRIATPKDTGLASDSWGYTIEGGNGGYTITIHNYDIEGGYNVALLVQYGHGTGTGGYVEGRDFINPAIQPIFDTLADEVWKGINS